MPNIRKLKSSEERRKVEKPKSLRRGNSFGSVGKRDSKSSLSKANREISKLPETRIEKPSKTITKLLPLKEKKKAEVKKKDNRTTPVKPDESQIQETETTPKTVPHFKAPRETLFRRPGKNESFVILESEDESEDEMKIVDDDKKSLKELKETPTRIPNFNSRRQMHERAALLDASIIYWDPEAAERQARGEKSEAVAISSTPSPVSPMVRLASFYPGRLKDRFRELQEKEKVNKQSVSEPENSEEVFPDSQILFDLSTECEKSSEENGFDNDDDSWLAQATDELENHYLATQVSCIPDVYTQATQANCSSNLSSTLNDAFDEEDDILLSQIELPC